MLVSMLACVTVPGTVVGCCGCPWTVGCFLTLHLDNFLVTASSSGDKIVVSSCKCKPVPLLELAEGVSYFLFKLFKISVCLSDCDLLVMVFVFKNIFIQTLNSTVTGGVRVLTKWLLGEILVNSRRAV